MNQSSTINFNVTFRKHDNSNVVQTSTDGVLYSGSLCERSICTIIVETEINAIIKIKMKWARTLAVILPIKKLGTESFFPSYENISSHYSIVAVNNGTSIYLQNANNLRLSINRGGWPNYVPVNNSLHRLAVNSMDFIDCVYPEDKSTRYYSRLVSNNHIAVFGYFTKGVDEWLDFQLKSVSMLGLRYIVYYPPFETPVKSVTNNVVKVVATQNNTEVTLSSNQSVMLAESESENLFIQPHESMFISADKPIMVFLLFSTNT